MIPYQSRAVLGRTREVRISGDGDDSGGYRGELL